MMNTKKLKFLLSFSVFKEKGELFNLYRGFVHCLSNLEAFELLIDKNTIGLRATALIEKIKYKFIDDKKNQKSELFRRARASVENLKWPQNQRVAKVLFGISPYVTVKEKTNLIKYFLSSKYYSLRRYGYDIIGKSGLEFDLKEELLATWDGYSDIEVLELIMDALTPEELFSIYNDAEEIFSDSEFDFNILKLRNKYYSKIIDFIPKRLEELKKKDLVSFVFVMKGAGRKFDKDLALKIFWNNRNYRSLPVCYGDLGMWDVLVEIYKKSKKKS